MFSLSIKHTVHNILYNILNRVAIGHLHLFIYLLLNTCWGERCCDLLNLCYSNPAGAIASCPVLSAYINCRLKFIILN